jgi:AmmeMemoRadiSam system protein A
MYQSGVEKFQVLEMKKMKNDTEAHNRLDLQHGDILLRLARKTIAEQLGCTIDPETVDGLQDVAFRRRHGTFVTLKIDGHLRGCIGNLTASDPLKDNIPRNAINAAFKDPRFSPLSPDELERVEIEVSILTEPRPLEYAGSRDLLDRLRPDIDGVILSKGAASATFLPQVWEQLPNAEDFLSHLCLKAGLPGDAWEKDKLEISIYQVQYFEEHG